MTSNRVIVFGPTGNIGSVTAITAHAKGAKVFLAMRDTSKSIRGLSGHEEAAGAYVRIQADITKPDTIAAAVQKSQAKSAFFYLAHGTFDHMRSSICALKSAGVEFVVFLSSYTIIGDAADVGPAEVIPWVHAQVEIHLEAIYGPDAYVAVRPGSFATNTLRWKPAIQAGLLRVQCPASKFDHITPTDMGRVSGSILATGRQQNGEKHVYLFGPSMLSQEEALQVVAKVLGKTIDVQASTQEESMALLQESGVPLQVAKYICSKLEAMGDTDGGTSQRSEFKAGQENILKYGGEHPTGFEEWLTANKELYEM